MKEVLGHQLSIFGPKQKHNPLAHGMVDRRTSPRRMNFKREMLMAAYRAIDTRDIEAVLAMMHPDVDWPNGMEGGRGSGQENVREYWTRQWGIFDPHVQRRAANFTMQ